MDYAKISEESLDKIMQQIRIENGMVSTVVNTPTPSDDKSESTIFAGSENLAMIDKFLAEAVIGKQIGLYRAPMYKQKGIKRVIARLIEKVYLRVSMLISRDIRDFNGIILSVIHAIKRELENLQSNDMTFQNEVENFGTEIKVLGSRFGTLSDEIRMLQNEYGTLENDLITLRNKYGTLKDELVTLRDEYGVLKDELVTLRNDIGILRDENACARAEIERTEQNNINLENRLTEHTSILLEKGNKNELLLRELNEEMVATKAIVKWVNNEQFTKAVETKIGTETLNNPVFYHEFEERFRGPQHDIRQRLMVYMPVLEGHFGTLTDKKFIDIGCGRGEWMDLLKERGAKDYIGVDINEIQLGISKEKGHPVVNQDCVAYIAGLADASVDMVSGIQIIEHLPLNILLVLLQECKRVLKPGGMILFETPNPSNLVTAATWFYTDPTHERPIHQEIATFLAEHSGFKNVRIIEVNPARYSQNLITPTIFDGNQNVWVENIELLNNLLYGPQDYALLGTKA